jgi:hypothetical protein
VGDGIAEGVPDPGLPVLLRYASAMMVP